MRELRGLNAQTLLAMSETSRLVEAVGHLDQPRHSTIAIALLQVGYEVDVVTLLNFSIVKSLQFTPTDVFVNLAFHCFKSR
jgi:hypothetical protein